MLTHEKPDWRYISPVLVLLVGIIATYLLMATRPALEPEKSPDTIPAVSVIKIKPQTLRLNIKSQGVVTARDEMDLMSEVVGKIIYLHPDFVAGGFFEKNEILAKIDPSDAEFALAQAQATLAEAKRQLAIEQAQVQHAKQVWQLSEKNSPPALVARQPQWQEAKAKLLAAQAGLDYANIRLNRCTLRAPFSGRFQTKLASIGQVVQIDDKLAHLYTTDIAEIRLPISTEQLAFLALPNNSVSYEQGIKVVLTAQLGDKTETWQGRIVRSEGVVDESTGVIYAVAQVKNPYHSPSKTPALLKGLFVQADIEGKELTNVFVLPAIAVNSSQQVLIVDKNSRLQTRHLNVLRNEKNRVLVKDDLTAGEQVVVSELDMPIENMQVKINLPDFKNLEGLGKNQP